MMSPAECYPGLQLMVPEPELLILDSEKDRPVRSDAIDPQSQYMKDKQWFNENERRLVKGPYVVTGVNKTGLGRLAYAQTGRFMVEGFSGLGYRWYSGVAPLASVRATSKERPATRLTG